jgi:hypothetical protein
MKMSLYNERMIDHGKLSPRKYKVNGDHKRRFCSVRRWPKLNTERINFDCYHFFLNQQDIDSTTGDSL